MAVHCSGWARDTGFWVRGLGVGPEDLAEFMASNGETLLETVIEKHPSGMVTVYEKRPSN